MERSISALVAVLAVECALRGVVQGIVVVHPHKVGHAQTQEGAGGVVAHHAKATRVRAIHALICILARKAGVAGVPGAIERMLFESCTARAVVLAGRIDWTDGVGHTAVTFYAVSKPVLVTRAQEGPVRV
jgi:hypothetical protein